MPDESNQKIYLKLIENIANGANAKEIKANQ